MSPLTLIIEASTRASTTASSFRTPHSLNHPLCTWVSSFNKLVSCIAVLLYQEKKLIYVLNLSHCISLFPTKDYQPLTPPLLLQLPSTRPLATSYVITLALGTPQNRSSTQWWQKLWYLSNQAINQVVIFQVGHPVSPNKQEIKLLHTRGLSSQHHHVAWVITCTQFPPSPTCTDLTGAPTPSLAAPCAVTSLPCSCLQSSSVFLSSPLRQELLTSIPLCLHMHFTSLSPATLATHLFLPQLCPPTRFPHTSAAPLCLNLSKQN